jgi:hypothetical protein
MRMRKLRINLQPFLFMWDNAKRGEYDISMSRAWSNVGRPSSSHGAAGGDVQRGATGAVGLPARPAPAVLGRPARQVPTPPASQASRLAHGSPKRLPPIRELRAASQTDVLIADDSGCWDSVLSADDSGCWDSACMRAVSGRDRQIARLTRPP